MAGNVDINTGAQNTPAPKQQPKSKWGYSTGEYNYNYDYDKDAKNFTFDMDDWYKKNGTIEEFSKKKYIPSQNPEQAEYNFQDPVTKKLVYVDDIQNAPAGVRVFKKDMFGFWNLAGTSSGAYVKQYYSQLEDEEKKKRTAAIRGHIAETKKQRQAEAEARAQKEEQDQQTALNNKVKGERENASKTSFLDMLSDENYDAKDSRGKDLYSPDDVIKAGFNAGLTYEEVTDAIKGTKWDTAKGSRPLIDIALDKYFGYETRGADRRELWAEVKKQNPDITPEQFKAIENEEGNEIINTAKSVITERKQKEEEERKRIADEQARKEQEEIDRLEKQGKAANTEAEQRKLNSDLDKKAREFEEKYPFPIAQFWNPGWDWKKKVLLLGEILANFGANITRGAVAGFNRQVADPVESPMNKYFKNALAAKNERYQGINQVKAKSVADSERRESIIDSLPNLKLLSNKERENIAVMFEGNVPSFEQFSKALEDFRTPEQRKAMYEEFKRGRVSYAEGSGNYSAELANKQAEANFKFSVAQNLIKTSSDANEYLASLERERQELSQKLIDIERGKERDFWEAAQYLMNYIGGIETANTSSSGGSSSSANSSRSSSENMGMNLNINGGYAAMGVQQGYNYSGSNGKSLTATSGYVNGKQTDLLKKMNIKTGLKEGKEYIEANEENRKILASQIKERIKDLDENLIPEAKELRKQVQQINDGIIKAPGQKQWIVREDGSKVELDPMDNIYATKNEITTENDNGADVVPMELTDTVEIIQKKLGYDGGNINKDFDYYLTKLRK